MSACVATPPPAKAGDDSQSVSVGARVRELRRNRRMSLRELARRLALSAATISQIEHGRTRLTVQRLTQIAEVLNVPVVDLLDSELQRVANDGDHTLVRTVGQPHQLRTAVKSARRADGTDWRAYPPLELSHVLSAALDAFLESGYGGATVRDIARRCNLSVPGLYHHYSSKQDMLIELLEIYMDSLLWRTTAARDEGHGPVERFALLVECLALHHTYRRALAFVGLSEMRSLQPKNRSRILQLRNQQQHMVDAEAEEAHRLGLFRTSDPHDASRAVVTMCTSIPHWYRAYGKLTPEEIACKYVRFSLDLMRPADARP
jgi:TetR/AcrR family transcriptional regulator, cholesterol catabolism regulator